MINTIHRLIPVMIIFLLGFTTAHIYDNLAAAGFEQPFTSALGLAAERQSPGDHVEQDKIHVYNNRIVIDLKDASWSTFADTNSMDPLIDVGTNGLEIKPTTPKDIKIGDVISFTTDFTAGVVIHRVINTGVDSEGWYAVTKGDNNPSADPGKRRFEDVQGVLVGVIY